MFSSRTKNMPKPSILTGVVSNYSTQINSMGRIEKSWRKWLKSVPFSWTIWELAIWTAMTGSELKFSIPKQSPSTPNMSKPSTREHLHALNWKNTTNLSLILNKHFRLIRPTNKYMNPTRRFCKNTTSGSKNPRKVSSNFQPIFSTKIPRKMIVPWKKRLRHHKRTQRKRERISIGAG